MLTLNAAWLEQLSTIMMTGMDVSPRGMLTKEIPQRTLIFDMNYPVITIPERKMGYRFMAAEAWWILSGRNDLASIEPYSKEIGRFSDDGEHFFGAYGPKIVDQLPYVIDTLIKDQDTRQAVITTWRENPPATKDVPCTIAFDFMIRNGKLNAHVFMRSSDNWLGIPYDAFNFSMLACYVLRRLNESHAFEDKLDLGMMYLTAASSHLYEKNFDQVNNVLRAGNAVTPEPVPEFLKGMTPHLETMGTIEFLSYLKDIKDPTESRYRWWNR